MAKPYGKKVTYLISPQALELIQQTQSVQTERKRIEKSAQKQHKEYQTAWIAALSSGTMTGRAFSSRTVRLYNDYSDEFFSRYSQLSAETLETALSRIPATSISKRQNFYKAMVSLGKYLIRQEALEQEFLETVKVLSPKRHIPPKRHTIIPEQLETLLQSCTDAQDRLIIQLLAATGIRNTEACDLRRSDVDLEKGILTVRCGKGGKQRKVGLHAETMEMLKNYLSKYHRAPESPLFLNAMGNPIDKDGLFQRVQRIGRLAGIKVSPHALRRAFVTINANKGRPLQMLQIACGHSSIKTTMDYCRTTEQEVIEAMKGWD